MRWIAWTCEECSSANRTRTRTGERMRCPRCEHLQLGPEAKAAHEAKLARVRTRQAAIQKPTKPTSKRARVRGPAPPAAAPAAPPPAPEPPRRQLGLVDRFLGYG